TDEKLQCLALTKDGNTLAAGGAGKDKDKSAGVIKLWDLAAGKEPRSLKIPDADFVSALAISDDGKYLAGVTQKFEKNRHESAVQVWDLTADKVLHTFPAGKGSFRTVAFAPSSELLAVGGGETDGGKIEGVVKLWDAKAGKQRNVFRVEDTVY